MSANCDIGTTAELFFDYCAHSHGLSIFRPESHDCEADRVVMNNDGSLFSIQIKNSRKRKSGAYRATTAKGCDSKIMYERVNYFAILVGEDWLIIPREDVKFVTLTFNKAKAEDSRYHQYLNNWEPLECSSSS